MLAVHGDLCWILSSNWIFICEFSLGLVVKSRNPHLIRVSRSPSSSSFRCLPHIYIYNVRSYV